MKRIIAALAFVAAPVLAGAQTTSPATAGITTAIIVKSSVTLTAGGNLDFGIVTPGSTGGVTAQGASTTGGSAGSVILNANQAVAVTAAFSSLAAAGLPSIAITSTSCGTSASSTTSTINTTLFNCATGTSSPAAGTGASGLYVFLGGSVATTATTPAGSYAGTATVTGTYTTY